MSSGRQRSLVSRARLWGQRALRRVALRGGLVGGAAVGFANLGRRGDKRIRAMPITWMDADTAHVGGLLRAPRPATAWGPRVGDAPAEEAQVRLPAVHYRIFRDARVTAPSSSVVLEEPRAFVERATAPDPEQCWYGAGQIVEHDAKNAIVWLWTPERLERGLFLGGNGSFNYYHWMIELLSKLEHLPRLPAPWRDFPLLVCEDVLAIPSLAQTLALYAPGREVIPLGKKAAYVVGELVYVEASSSLPFNLRDGRQLETGHTAMDREAIAFLRDRALTAVRPERATRAYPSRILLCRKGNLRRYNQDEVCARLAPLGFVPVLLEEMTFAEQVTTLNRAEVIAGPTGAAWTNLIFCREGAKAVCWMAEESGAFSAYSTLARLVGVDLRYVTYRAGVGSTRDLYTEPYAVDPAAIEQALGLMGVTA